MFSQLLHKVLPVLSLILTIVLCLLVSACSISQDIYMQELDARGHVFTPPAFITDSTTAGQFRIVPFVSAGRRNTLEGSVEGHTMVNATGIYQLDTTYNGNEITLRETPGANIFSYTGKNFRWDIPDIVFGLDGDIAVSKSLSLAFGLQYSAQASEGFWGGNIGFGVHSTGETMAIRWDGGVHWTPISYDALTVVVTRTSVFGSSSEDVAVFHDRGQDTRFGFYSSVTANSRRPDWPLNFLLGFGFSSQRVTNYEPQTNIFEAPFFSSIRVTDARASVRATFLHAALGAYVSPLSGQRLLFGVRWIGSTDVVDATNLFVPFVRFEILL